MGVVFCHHCRIWLDITYLEQPGATCPVFFSPHESGYPVADFRDVGAKPSQRMDQVLQPLSGGPVPPSTVGSRLWKGHNLQGLPGLSAPSSLHLMAALPHFHASLCSQALLWSRKGGGSEWQATESSKFKISWKKFYHNFFFKWPYIVYLLSLKNPE